MKNGCFDIGVIQTFVDGELDLRSTEKVVRHLTVCANCTDLVSELEAENEFAFSTMEPEFNVLVPTERLRAKVFASIREIDSKEKKGIWTGLAGILGIAGGLLRPAFAAPAALIVLAGFALFTFEYSGVKETESLKGVEARVEVESDQNTPGPVAVVKDDAQDFTPVENESEIHEPLVSVAAAQAKQEDFTVSNAVEITTPKMGRSTTKNTIPVRVSNSAVLTPNSTIEAEDGYLRTIATLNQTVQQNKDFVLRPNERVAFERDLAVVDDAIKKLKGEVRDNPSNTAAREILRSSYKNKIELLNSVAERAETVASLE